VFQVYQVDLVILAFRVVLDFRDKKILDMETDFHIGYLKTVFDMRVGI